MRKSPLSVTCESLLCVWVSNADTEMSVPPLLLSFSFPVTLCHLLPSSKAKHELLKITCEEKNCPKIVKWQVPYLGRHWSRTESHQNFVPLCDCYLSEINISKLFVCLFVSVGFNLTKQYSTSSAHALWPMICVFITSLKAMMDMLFCCDCNVVHVCTIPTLKKQKANPRNPCFYSWQNLHLNE